MSTTMIIVLLVVVVAAIGGYMYISGGLPTYTAPAATQDTGTTAVPADSTSIDTTGSASVADQAGAAATDVAKDLSSADSIDIPDVK